MSAADHIADQLPPEIAHQIHLDRRKNEADYWAAVDHRPPLVAGTLGVSTTTVEADWRFVRAWLRGQLGDP
jgi:hypothetical protein